MADRSKYDEHILLSSLWNQYGKIKFGENESDVDFNKYAPVDPVSNKKSFTGCVNTAMGQIVYYFLENNLLPDYNLSLNERDSYVSLGNAPQRAITIIQDGSDAVDTPAFSVINDNLEYIAAPTDPEAEDYSEKINAAGEFVAALNFAYGVINRSMYSYVTGTGAYFHTHVWERSGFKSVMHSEPFSSQEQARWFDITTDENGEQKSVLTDELFELFIENLSDNRPILIGIPGHAVVMDGYCKDDEGNDLFHINFGWGDEGGGGSSQEGTSKSTKWYTREELAPLNITVFHSELQSSYIEEFTVNDGRFYGTGTFLRALEKANAMQGDNLISFAENSPGSTIELPYAYKFTDETLVRDFNLTICGNSAQDESADEQQNIAAEETEETEEQTDEKKFMLFAGDDKASIRFENFNGNAILMTDSVQGSSIFDFSASIRSDLFFNGVKFYSGKAEETVTYDEILQALEENAGDLAEKTENAFSVAASDGDDTIKFDQNSVAVGNIDLGVGHNKLIINGGSQIFGDIGGDGENTVFIDSTSSVTGSLQGEIELYFTVEDLQNRTAFDPNSIFEITGNAEDSFKNISAITVDAVGASAGEYIIFNWNSDLSGVLENLQYEIIGNAELTEKDNCIVLTVGDENAPLELQEEWNIETAISGNVVTLNWNGFENIGGYSFRYSQDAETLVGSGFDTEVNSTNIVLNNGTWYFQVRAFDEEGTYSDWSTVKEVVVDNSAKTETDVYLANGSITGKTVDTAFKVLSGGVIENTAVSGKLILENGSTATGYLTIEEEAVVEVHTGAEFIFDISSFEKANSESIINNFAAVNGTFKFGITVSESQAVGKYILAENVENWDPATIKVKANDIVLGSLDDEDTTFFYEDKVYSLIFSKEENQLLFTVEDAVDTDVEQDGSISISWNAPHGASGYVFELSNDNFSSSLRIATAKNELNVAAPLDGLYSWRSKAVGFDHDFTCNGEFQSSAAAAESNTYVGTNDDGKVNIFLAKSDGEWGDRYIARHVNLTEEQLGTDNNVTLNGKKRYQDIYQGSDENSNILYLSDDSNGDAFFSDDIYSAFPDEESRSRFTEISEIYAGAGDDIIDMTSTRFEAANKNIIIHGGEGNDVIWADSSGCYLGDAGDDFIVGSEDTDHISGGSGDDYLHGGGGDDYFLYSTTYKWGNDTIYQLDGGSVNIVFFENVNADSFTREYDENGNLCKISHENGSITFYGNCEIKSITYRNYDKIDEALTFGGFWESSSEKIFVENSDGMLA